MDNERILANIKAKKLSLDDLQDVAASGTTSSSISGGGTYNGHNVDEGHLDYFYDF